MIVLKAATIKKNVDLVFPSLLPSFALSEVVILCRELRLIRFG